MTGKAAENRRISSEEQCKCGAKMYWLWNVMDYAYDLSVVGGTVIAASSWCKKCGRVYDWSYGPEGRRDQWLEPDAVTKEADDGQEDS